MHILHKHTYAKITLAYICKDYTSIHMHRLPKHTYAKITQAYICKDYSNILMKD